MNHIPAMPLNSRTIDAQIVQVFLPCISKGLKTVLKEIKSQA